MEHLEDVLQHLAYENNVQPGSCCACLQDVDTQGHPPCIISMALIAIEEWREYAELPLTSALSGVFIVWLWCIRLEIPAKPPALSVHVAKARGTK